MSCRVAIVDSGGANIASLRFALERLGVEATLTADPDIIRSAHRVILPGVGAAADAMSKLRRQRLDEVIPTLTQPVLGICLGMQLLAESSQEDDARCLGVVPLQAVRLHASIDTPAPHMGWSRVRVRREHALLHGIDRNGWFYFVHSYVLPIDSSCIASAEHGVEFSAISVRGNFCATQFHPERSAAAGARLLQNFLQLPT